MCHKHSPEVSTRQGALQSRYRPLGPVQRLNLAFLVHAQHQRLVWRVQVVGEVWSSQALKHEWRLATCKMRENLRHPINGTVHGFSEPERGYAQIDTARLFGVDRVFVGQYTLHFEGYSLDDLVGMLQTAAFVENPEPRF